MLGHVGVNNQAFVLGQAGLAQGVEVALPPVFVDVQVLRPGQVGNAAAALAQQVARGDVAALLVVQHHGVHFVALQNPVKKHEGQAAAAHFLEVLEVVGGARQRHQNAGHLRAEQRVEVALLLGHVLVRLANDDVVAGLAGGRFDAVHHGRKEPALDVRHHNAEQLALALAQRRGHAVGLIVVFLAQLKHFLLHRRPNAVVVAQGSGNGREGHPQLPGQVGHGNRARALGVWFGFLSRGHTEIRYTMLCVKIGFSGSVFIRHRYVRQPWAATGSKKTLR